MGNGGGLLFGCLFLWQRGQFRTRTGTDGFLISLHCRQTGFEGIIRNRLQFQRFQFAQFFQPILNGGRRFVEILLDGGFGIGQVVQVNLAVVLRMRRFSRTK